MDLSGYNWNRGFKYWGELTELMELHTIKFKPGGKQMTNELKAWLKTGQLDQKRHQSSHSVSPFPLKYIKIWWVFGGASWVCCWSSSEPTMRSDPSLNPCGFKSHSFFLTLKTLNPIGCVESPVHAVCVHEKMALCECMSVCVTVV